MIFLSVNKLACKAHLSSKMIVTFVGGNADGRKSVFLSFFFLFGTKKWPVRQTAVSLSSSKKSFTQNLFYLPDARAKHKYGRLETKQKMLENSASGIFNWKKRRKTLPFLRYELLEGLQSIVRIAVRCS